MQLEKLLREQFRCKILIYTLKKSKGNMLPKAKVDLCGELNTKFSSHQYL